MRMTILGSEELCECPWCGEAVVPIPNDGTGNPTHGTREQWFRLNPLQCPRCENVGGYEDFVVIEFKQPTKKDGTND